MAHGIAILNYHGLRGECRVDISQGWPEKMFWPVSERFERNPDEFGARNPGVATIVFKLNQRAVSPGIYECAGCVYCGPIAERAHLNRFVRALYDEAVGSQTATVIEQVRKHLLNARIVAVGKHSVEVQFGNRRRAFPWTISRARAKRPGRAAKGKLR